MSARDMYYPDYGITYDDAFVTIDMCRDATGEKLQEILRAAIESNSGVAQYLFANLTIGIGYDTMSKWQDIPMQRKDFQGYRRRAIYILTKKWAEEAQQKEDKKTSGARPQKEWPD